ncbi:MAG: MBL fold metallo-hydrolase [Acidobacteria bacterium]|nr:MAG: MBL fold metallo-hydrolase [Acidobacteriota bacterium]
MRAEMPVLASGLDYVDLQFLGRPELIATGILHGAAGVALVDPGPATTLSHLETALERKGIRFGDVRWLLVTHIHLDHAGAAGLIVDKHPHIDVYVHGRGAPHMIDPSKLLSSAGRLYGQDMDRLWGAVLPIPQSRIRVLDGGETLHVAGRELRVEYTPGHASHHVAYFDTSSRIAFVGDTAGIRRGSGKFVLPATPPPDIDLEVWRESERRILAWDPDTLFLTHFGPWLGARQHFQAMFDNLTEWNRIVRRVLADQSLNDPDRERLFIDEAYIELQRRVGEREAEDYVKAGGLNYSWQGLSRYWRKRDESRA